MKLLDSRGNYTRDRFLRDTGEKAFAAGEKVLVPLEALAASPGAGGVEVPNTADVATLRPFFGRLELIAVAFPGHMDGRGFSLARRLRNAGFTGAIRAVGPLIAEQFAYGLSCGFSEFEIPDGHAARMPGAGFKAALQAFSATYQRGYAHRGVNILEARRAARQEGRNA